MGQLMQDTDPITNKNQPLNNLARQHALHGPRIRVRYLGFQRESPVRIGFPRTLFPREQQYSVTKPFLPEATLLA